MLPAKPATSLRASALVERFAAVKDDVEGVSFLGGEPTEQAEGLGVVARSVRAHGKSVMVFSGYTLDELRAQRSAHVDALLAHTDLLVDGRYVQEQRTTSRRYIGSTNQVLHFLSDRYRADDPRFAEGNTLEIRLKDGAITVNGYPIDGALTRIGRAR